MRKDSDFVYWKEARSELKDLITSKAMELSISPSMSVNGMVDDDLTSHNERVAFFNEGIRALEKALLPALEGEKDDG